MNFLKPTWQKLTIALVLTLWPYVASFIYVSAAGEGTMFSDHLVRFSFWEHTFYWSPLYFLVQLTPHQSNDFWHSKPFLFIYYPLIRFAIRYLVACLLVFLVAKLSRKHFSQKQSNSS